MQRIDGKRVAILATNGFEESELTEPLKALRNAGADVTVVSLENGKIRGVRGTDWSDEIEVDATLDSVSETDFDALVLPGGVYNPDILRTKSDVVDFIRAMFDARKPVAAICHGPWLLIEAGLVKGRKATSYSSIKTDMINAGAEWLDEEVIVDNGLVTSRNPDDLEAFCAKVIEEIAEGEHDQRAQAASSG